MLFFEDFSGGEELDLGSWTVGEDEIVAFARDWDPQFFHIDPEAAGDGPFGGLVASGWHKHLVVEPLIEVAGDEATSTSYLAVLRDEDGVPVLWVFGRYRDGLARCPDGRWRFTERIAEVESVDARYPSLAFRRP